MISCTVSAGDRAIAAAVITVVVLPARIEGVAGPVETAVAGAEGCVAGAGCGAGVRVTRPSREAHSDDGSTRLRFAGGLTSMAGSSSAEAVCCACAVEKLRQTA